MANSIITAEAVAGLSVELLSRQLVLPNTVLRVNEDDYRGTGGTVSVRVRTPRLARTQDTPGTDVIFDNIEEHSVDVTLSHLYDGALLTDEDMTLDLVNFGQQVTEPQTASVATAAEALLAAQMNALTPNWTDTSTVGDEGETGTAYTTVLLAREWLTKNNVPLGRRWLACGPEYMTELLNDPRVSRADASGSPSALRDAIVTRLHGFNVVESNAITSTKAVAYHESAFVFASKTPTSRTPGVDSASSSKNGVGLRQIFQYLASKLSMASVISTYGGAGTITEDGDDPGAVQKRAVAMEVTDVTSS